MYIICMQEDTTRIHENEECNGNSRKRVIVEHCNIIEPTFWDAHPTILSGWLIMLRSNGVPFFLSIEGSNFFLTTQMLGKFIKVIFLPLPVLEMHIAYTIWFLFHAWMLVFICNSNTVPVLVFMFNPPSKVVCSTGLVYVAADKAC